jgi:hypothetical protein
MTTPTEPAPPHAINLPHVALGLCLIALGVALLLHQAGMVEIERILRYWPVALVLIGAAMLWPALRGGTAAEQSAPLGAIFWIIVFGLAISYVAERRPRVGDQPGTVHAFAIMSRDDRLASGVFRGGSITAVLGRNRLDLRQASLASGEVAEIDVFTLFGAADINVPPGWQVSTETTTVAGGVSDDRPDREAVAGTTAGPRLVVHGAVFFGGLRIRP